MCGLKKIKLFFLIYFLLVQSHLLVKLNFQVSIIFSFLNTNLSQSCYILTMFYNYNYSMIFTERGRGADIQGIFADAMLKLGKPFLNAQMLRKLQEEKL